MEVWSSTIRKSDDWLLMLGRDLGTTDLHAMRLALRAVLHTVRDRLPMAEAVEFAAQMPLLLKGVYFDGWDPGAPPVRLRTRQRFLASVEECLRGTSLASDPDGVTRAVFRLLATRISAGEIHDVQGCLPPEIAELWLEEAGPGASGCRSRPSMTVATRVGASAATWRTAARHPRLRPRWPASCAPTRISSRCASWARPSIPRW